MDLREEINNLPEAPGVYLFVDGKGKVLYIGKSKSLRHRVRSYLNLSGDSRPLVQDLPQRAEKIDFIVTDTEKEALILENSLINKHNPECNVMFRDDSNYVSLKVDSRHSFPRVTMTRTVKKDGARYFGPYTSVGALRETMQIIKKHFLIRTCTNAEFKRRKRPCLLYQIDRCGAPCVGKQTAEEYSEIIDDLILFLRGRDKTLIKSLEEEMYRASDDLEFERAARLRDKIKAIGDTIEKQKVISNDSSDRDIFVALARPGSVVVQTLFIREGKVMASKGHLVSTNQSAGEVLSAYLKQYYCRQVYLPHEILLSEEIEDGELLAELASEKKGKKVRLHVPQRGKKMDLIRLARKNARLSFKSLKARRQARLDILCSLQDQLDLRNIPQRIECFDISNIQGAYAVGSRVVFEMTEPLKSEYRRYKIRSVDQADDYSMMKEVLCRRFRQAQKKGNLPDLAVIDGGKGQLAAAWEVFRDLEIQGVDLIALAKSRKKKTSRGIKRTPERVFLLGREEPVVLKEGSEELYLLERLRDEAHRFAINYHRTLRRNEILGQNKK